MHALKIKKGYQKPRGAVLILVLGAVAILAVLAIELSRRAQITVTRASHTTRDAAFRRAFNSALEIAKGNLIEHRLHSGFDDWGDGWSTPIQVAFEDTQITVQIFDESGKLNLSKVMSNRFSSTDAAFYNQAFTRLVTYLREHDTSGQTQWDDVLTALQTRLGLSGAGTPQPLLTLDGLRESGLSQELIFGNPKTPDILALCNYVSVFGDGKLNLNTAPQANLYALDNTFDDNITTLIVQWRGGEIGSSPNTYLPFKQTKELESVKGVVTYGRLNGATVVTQNLLTIVQDHVSVMSTCFSVRIDVTQTQAQNGQSQRQRTAWAFFELPPSPQKLTVDMLKLLSYEEVGL